MLNHITIAGRLVRDPELRRTNAGVAVTSFTVAVDRDYTQQNGERETDFIDCIAWRNTAEFVSKYFTKGRLAIVSGRLEIRPWTDKDGNKRRATEVIAESVYFGDTKREGASTSMGDYSATAPAPVQTTMPAYSQIEEEDGNLPF